MTVKFITVKGPDRLARAPFYLGIPQHERTMSKREAYELIALKTGYTSTAVKAAFCWLPRRYNFYAQGVAADDGFLV